MATPKGSSLADTVLAEPSQFWIYLQVVAVWVFPYLAYFLGIYIRKRVFPGDNSPDLYEQLLLGIPVCLVVVSPMISALQKSFGSHLPTYLFTVGIIMEHGMILHETASKHIKQHLDKLNGSKDRG